MMYMMCGCMMYMMCMYADIYDVCMCDVYGVCEMYMCKYMMYMLCVCMRDVYDMCVCIWRSEGFCSVSSLLPLLYELWGSSLGHQACSASIPTCWAIATVCHFSQFFLLSGLISQRAR